MQTSEFSYYMHDHSGCAICSTNTQGCDKIKADLQEIMDEGLIHIIRPRAEYEEGVNVIVPCFGSPTPFEVEYHSKPAIAPLVISLSGPVPYKSDKVVPYKYNCDTVEELT